ncbi:LADA_0C09516g1_1 [Lachancea dasiensis]|uniref:LADA_0C09516g1_1 n=1 Tax=Lachancea dasiensis TaxID=1072105 RepID=A0A1G4J0W5_9SACH|nr:LADA_0C09516g1_1 [Lachancea dasiensis]
MSEQQETPASSEAQQQQPRVPRANSAGSRSANSKGPRSNQKPYNGNQTSHSGNSHRYNKNSGHYKNNRTNVGNNSNSNNGAGMPNMQWGYGSYNMTGQPQFYPSYGYGYMPAMAAQGYNPAAAAAAAAAAAGQSHPGSVSPADVNAATPLATSNTPVAKKIEITNRSGEQVDLNAIHSQHMSGMAAPLSASQSPSKDTPVASVSASPEVSTSNKSAPEASSDESKEPSADELLKMSFLEQVRLRKAMRAQKKSDDAPQTAAVAATEDVPETPKSTSVKTEQISSKETGNATELTSDGIPVAETNQEPVTEGTPEEHNVVEEEVPVTDDTTQPVKETAETVQPSKPLTFAEKLRLKNKIPAKTEPVENQVDSTPVDADTKVDAGNSKPEEEPEEESGKGPEEVSKEDTKLPSEGLASTDIEHNEINLETTSGKEEATGVELEDETKDDASVDAETTAEEAKNPDEDEDTDVDDGRLTMTELLSKLDQIPAVEDIYSFDYPEGIEAPDARHKKSKVKYTYGPTFLLQFQEKVNVRTDAEWKKNVASKIVIPPGTVRQGNRARGDSKFGQGVNFKKSGSMRGMEGRSNSRSNSKRKSKRMGDDRKSNRAYTSRKDREKMAEEEAQKALEEAAPLVPSANRWVPKSKQKKTEKKFAPDGVTELIEKDEAERKMKSLLNKLTLEKFDLISEDIIKIADQSKWETDCVTLKVVIEQIFLKACDEPHWSSMYAQLCGKVVKDMDPEIKEEGNDGKTGPKLVLHYLVDRCHAEFQKGWSDKLPTKEDGSPLEPEMMSDEYYQMAAAKRRGLGLVRLIGFLYRSHLLTAKMMFECFRRLMKDLSDSPSEETLESVLELLSTVGEQFEDDRLVQPSGSLEGSTVLDQLFYMLDKVTETSDISSRIKFKLIDMKELREVKNWNNAKRDEGPKTIQQIHEEEAAKKALEERERKFRGSSRSGSRRTNSNTSMGNRSNSRREPAPVSKDSFIATRSSSLRHVQGASKEETPQQKTAVNMFDALMGAESDDDE